ncbi:MAG: hypothetical protein LQ352_007333 [Teloschistes flavicans]|nr:MAG: hypothetical protein LQ352_007333 [Teloschistes flavicans]
MSTYNHLSAPGESAADSEYDSSSYTTSLTSSKTAYQYQHGRRYHAYQSGRYDLPNDELEQQRLELQYHALRLAFGDKLFFAPIGDKPTKVLDVGTGTGIWAIDVAESLPDTQVTGTDLSPIQPNWVPPNCSFEVDDAEQLWTFPVEHFDLVHTRIMNAFVQDWDRLFEQSFRHLKPGGWMECQELSVAVHSDDGTLSEDSYVRRWCNNEEAAWNKIGLSVNLEGKELQTRMEKAGFVNTTVQIFKLPIGTWPADSKLKEIGAIQLVAMLEGLEGLTIAPWVRHLGWKEEDVGSFIEKVKNEWKDKNIHTHFPLWVCYPHGRSR